MTQLVPVGTTETPSRRRKTTTRKHPKRVLNVLPSKNVDQDWAFENASGAGIVRATRLPAEMDLRESWWKIGDQGATGSCVGWATADSVLRWMYVRSGQIPMTDRLSTRFIWMAAKETDEFTSAPTTFIEDDGTSLKAALDVARKFGAVTDKVLPFSGQLYPYPAKTFYAMAAKLKIKSYFNLGRAGSSWRTWIATQGPILTRLDVDATFDGVGKDGKMDVYQASTASGGHAVAIVGYTRTAFIVRNSWGTSWGASGYAFASVKYAEKAFTEAYGVTV